MRPLNVTQAIVNSCATGDVSLSMIAEITELPKKLCLNPLRSNRVYVRLREPDIGQLETRALETGMPFQAFLEELIHKYASGSLEEKK